MKFFLRVVVIVSFLHSGNAFADKKVINIGTGNKAALAYPIISAMCDIFNQNNVYSQISCRAIETGGAEENLNGIISGKYDMGVIKADMEYNVYNGIASFKGKSYKKLRNLFGLHNEYLTILVKKDSNIKDLMGFKNRRVYLGNKGSGSRILVDKLFERIGLREENFESVNQEQPDQIYNLFCQDKIDAAIYLVGHPNSVFTKTMNECGVKIIGFSRKEIETYIDFFYHVYPAVIVKGIYKNQDYDIDTFASQLLLASSENLDEQIVYDFVQIIYEHREEIYNKILAMKDAPLLSKNLNLIPIHKGAARYYNALN